MSLYYKLDTKQIAILAYACSATCCLSLACVSLLYPEFHIRYFSGALWLATAITVLFACTSCLFGLARFSLGYAIGFYLYVMILGYLWLNSFSDLPYNHAVTGLSAAASALSFLLPALLINEPLPRLVRLSERTASRGLTLILMVSMAVILVGAWYNFRMVGIDRIYDFREALAFPTPVSYLLGITSNSLLPFAFACFVLRKNLWRAGLVIFLILLIYPITLAKASLFAPVWLVGLTVVSRFIDARSTVVLSVFAPIVFGLLIFFLVRQGMLHYGTITYFGLVNFRMIAIPSVAMDYYNYFFSTHESTYFCQVQFVKALVSCPYTEPLSVVIYKFFGIGGYFNASLFATEGVASVGTLFAPFSALACGLVIAVGNRLSAGLPDRFILISSAIIAQTLMNVPLTTVMLSYGGGLLFLLLYLTPREMFHTGHVVQADLKTSVA
ncbi:hypothetical protein XI06_02555 [Bradyrhizobium sp. CCBAU 11434]|uniref:hypothetical protein n=1 Tax=Bradyrhizobium sp. CCBAU 11434 TaxID=1630885 RepID=UPI0023051665|nr:hypothetical protein [Bradyrhizobium sp. CCBAU 11434]MDA9519255.1 hypothetical protein [Bradyrhizobium sp. CCBAU 11434]